MPRLDDFTDSYLRESEQGVRHHTWRVWDSFANFALRDNVLEVAVGLILAAAFTACANSLVTDIILPIISLLPFLSRNLDEKFTVFKAGPHYNESISAGYNTKKQAQADGAVVFAWGTFIDTVVRFLILATSMWLIAMIYSKTTDDNIVKRQVRCKYCRKYISEKAKRCVNCTSWVDGRDDH